MTKRHDGEISKSAAIAGLSNRRARAVLRMLLDGNHRFVGGRPLYTRDISSARAAASEQRPVAAVFTCVDSRVTAESLFDCDFGQLIVVRTAAHVPDRAAVDSLVFAVDQLDVPLVIVLGHERCGAVKLAIDAVRGGDKDAGFLVESLRQPAARALRSAPDDPYTEAMRLQVSDTVERLTEREDLRAAHIAGARYDLDEGTVHMLK
ncbi:MAG TPA: carbonic anhydrase [Stackebrandtia sp.]|uniref:carbonic anhydrase n=1 Tax=Stackebrandtia sp. TaxID=2023065 RepID=UPI002D640FE1|nr:carbonic anhydrase [Stackebrandtia sp.]HZE38710.1 carbonic anhydrase [Stackebrandtia sp.]